MLDRSAIQRRDVAGSGFGNEHSNVNRKSPNDMHSTTRISIQTAPAARKRTHAQYSNNAGLFAMQTSKTGKHNALYLQIHMVPCREL